MQSFYQRRAPSIWFEARPHAAPSKKVQIDVCLEAPVQDTSLPDPKSTSEPEHEVTHGIFPQSLEIAKSMAVHFAVCKVQAHRQLV